MSAVLHWACVLSILLSKLSAKFAHACRVLLFVAQAMHLSMPVRCYDLASTWHMHWQVPYTDIFQHLLLQHAPPIFTPRFAARAKLLSPAALMHVNCRLMQHFSVTTESVHVWHAAPSIQLMRYTYDMPPGFCML